VVYHLKKYNMTVTVAYGDRMGPIVQLALGSEVRTLQLAEFTNFLLAMIEEGRKATTAHLETLGELYRKKNGKKERSNSHT
jgi:hypothetical protein